MNVSTWNTSAAATLAWLAFATGGVQAQAYPARTVRVIVPWPAGGGTDMLARPIAQKMGEILGQQVVVDNRGGASGHTRAVNRVPACGM